MKANRILCALLAFLCSLTIVAGIPAKPDTVRFVNDYANIFPAEEAARLNDHLLALSDTTGNQIVVVTVNDLEGYEPVEYAQRLGQSWGVGTKENDNGVVILIKPRNEKGRGEVFIATGYGSEGVLPDILCDRIIDERMFDHLKAGNYFAAAEAGALACEQALVGEFDASDLQSDEMTTEDWGSTLGAFGLMGGGIYYFYRRSKKKMQRNALLRHIQDSTDPGRRDAAIQAARDSKFKFKDKEIYKAVALGKDNMLKLLSQQESPKKFESFIPSVLAMGVEEQRINELRSKMKSLTLNSVKSCRSKHRLNTLSAQAINFGNDEKAVRDAMAFALAAIAAEAARRAAAAASSSSSSHGSFGGGGSFSSHRSFGGGSFGGGGAGRHF